MNDYIAKNVEVTNKLIETYFVCFLQFQKWFLKVFGAQSVSKFGTRDV